mmetsp:Transcript_36443/g.96127  ORF Transcript_36443/g.96127 Transcript_36443/m.96127 type:complete len:329 (-) Transcript_36443:161-1147(-)
MRTKMALEIQYLGTAYIGWQPQGHAVGGKSVYEIVAEALSSLGITSGPVAAGRTDKGVHAMSMWLTVTVRRACPITPGPERNLELDHMQQLLNVHLPADVRVLQVLDAPLSANAMAGSSGKTYTYFLLQGAKMEAAAHTHGFQDVCWLIDGTLDVGAMQAALPALVGHHNFRALCAVQDPKRSTERTITHASLFERRHMMLPLFGCLDAPCAEAEGCMIQLRFSGDGFLKHQVRRMVGLLVRIGRHEELPGAMSEALRQPELFARDRGLEAPACGLWLESVDVKDMLGGVLGAKQGHKRSADSIATENSQQELPACSQPDDPGGEMHL